MEVNVRNVDDKIQEVQLCCFGHMHRMNEEDLGTGQGGWKDTPRKAEAAMDGLHQRRW